MSAAGTCAPDGDAVPAEALRQLAHWREQLRLHGGKGRVTLHLDEAPGRPVRWSIEVQALPQTCAPFEDS